MLIPPLRTEAIQCVLSYILSHLSVKCICFSIFTPKLADLLDASRHVMKPFRLRVNGFVSEGFV